MRPIRAAGTIAAALAIATTVGACSSNSSGHTPAATSSASHTATTQEKNYNAYTACKDAVTDRLKSPSTAKFQPESQVAIGPADNGATRVSGYVDSQNGFGAMVRSDFSCFATVDDVGIVTSTTVASIHTRT